MTIHPDIVEYVRTFIRDEYTENDRIEERLAQTGLGEDFASFLSAVFFFAVDRRFDGTNDRAAIIRFVADLRAQDGPGGLDVEAPAAEAVIAAVFDPTTELNVTADSLAAIQVHVIHKAISDLQLTDDELNELLREAEQLASQ
jgi:hypothetical protein